MRKRKKSKLEVNTVSEQIKDGGYNEEIGIQFGIAKDTDQPLRPEELAHIRKEMVEKDESSQNNHSKQ